MKLRSRLATAAAVALLGMGSIVLADVKIETLPADQAFAAETYTVSIPETSVPELIEAFKKQTGLALTIGNDGDQRRGGPIMLAALSFKDLSRDAALDQLGRAVGMRVQFEGSSENPTIRLYEGGAGLSDSSMRNRGRDPVARVSYINRNESMPANPDYQSQGISLQVEVSPGVEPLTTAMRIDLSEVTDEQGRSLVPPPPPNRGPRFSGGGSTVRTSYSLSVNLKYEQPRPAVIKKLKGTVLVQRPKTIRRVTATDFADKALTVDFDNGSKLTIGPAKIQGQNINLKMRLDRGSQSDAEWERLQDFYRSATAAKVFTAGGQPMGNTGHGGSSGSRYYEATLNLYVQREGGGMADAAALAAPENKVAKLVWDMIVDTEELSIPIEASDIVVP